MYILEFSSKWSWASCTTKEFSQQAAVRWYQRGSSLGLFGSGEQTALDTSYHTLFGWTDDCSKYSKGAVYAYSTGLLSVSSYKPMPVAVRYNSKCDNTFIPYNIVHHIIACLSIMKHAMLLQCILYTIRNENQLHPNAWLMKRIKDILHNIKI